MVNEYALGFADQFLLAGFPKRFHALFLFNFKVTVVPNPPGTKTRTIPTRSLYWTRCTMTIASSSTSHCLTQPWKSMWIS